MPASVTDQGCDQALTWGLKKSQPLYDLRRSALRITWWHGGKNWPLSVCTILVDCVVRRAGCYSLRRVIASALRCALITGTKGIAPAPFLQPEWRVYGNNEDSVPRL